MLGLIHVMENLSDPSRLGAGIAVAFVSTVYGVGLANLFFYPVGNKIKGIVAERVPQYEILTDVFHDIATGDYTRVIEERVACLLARALTPSRPMARRKRYDEDTENHERWLISYADFITLLFAFFVVMYAISVVNVGKYTVLSEALGDAFGGRGAATKIEYLGRGRAAAAVEHHRAQARGSGQARPRAPRRGPGRQCARDARHGGRHAEGRHPRDRV